MIIRYVRDKDGKPIGCVVGLDTEHHIGWSLCGKNDIFTKKMARTIAWGRVTHGTKKDVPRKMLTVFNEVRWRVENES